MSAGRRVAKRRMQETDQLRRERDQLARVVTRFAVLHAALVLSCRIDDWSGRDAMRRASKRGRSLLRRIEERER